MKNMTLFFSKTGYLTVWNEALRAVLHYNDAVKTENSKENTVYLSLVAGTVVGVRSNATDYEVQLIT